MSRVVDDDALLPMVDSAAVMLPKSGIAEPENMLPPDPPPSNAVR